MYKYNTIFILSFCFSCSDYVQDLGKGYSYRNKGGTLKDIFHEYPDKGGEIPPTVLAYKFNSKYIIAKQRPKLPQEAIRTQYKYESGDSIVYYWIIDNNKYKCYGPMNRKQFTILREKLELPYYLKFQNE